MSAALPPEATDKPVEVWFTDEARMGQQGTITRVWAKRGSHLAEISRRISVGAIAVLVLDGAGWHTSPRLNLPDNIVLLPLPAYSPELNPIENVWDFLRANFLSHCVWDTY